MLSPRSQAEASHPKPRSREWALDSRDTPTPPAPLLTAEDERELSVRQRQILDTLEALTVQDGFAELTMAQLAKRVNCSLRTLYGLAPHKDELLLTVVDRRLQRIARAAHSAAAKAFDPLTALRNYLEVASAAIDYTRQLRESEPQAIAGATALSHRHGNHVVAMTGHLLERSVESGQVAPVDTTALALVLGGLGGYFSNPLILPRISGSPRQASEAVMEVILRGLARPVASD